MREAILAVINDGQIEWRVLELSYGDGTPGQLWVDNGVYRDWPLRHKNGSTTWGYPERLPDEVLNRATELMDEAILEGQPFMGDHCAKRSLRETGTPSAPTYFRIYRGEERTGEQGAGEDAGPNPQDARASRPVGRAAE